MSSLVLAAGALWLRDMVYMQCNTRWSSLSHLFDTERATSILVHQVEDLQAQHSIHTHFGIQGVLLMRLGRAVAFGRVRWENPGPPTP